VIACVATLMWVKKVKKGVTMDMEIRQSDSSGFVSPKTLAERWQCSRASVDRITRRAGMTRLCLGKGKNGMVRYLWKEVIAYEKERRIRMVP